MMCRHHRARALPLALAAMTLAPRLAWAQREAFSWHAPAGECPTEDTVRDWLAREVAIGGEALTTRVVVSASHGEGGWRAVIRRRNGAGIAAHEVTAGDCEALARTVVQEVVFDTAVLPEAPPRDPPAPVGFVLALPDEVAPPPALPPPPLVAPAAPARADATPSSTRVWFDLGLGLGAAYVGEGASAVEMPPGPANTTCDSGGCSFSPGFRASTFAHMSVRLRVSERIAVGVQARLQFDAAPWTQQRVFETPLGTVMATEQSNPFANLLVGARVYYALSSQGFDAEGLSWSLFAGAGLGQIEPALSGNGSLHARSGFGNVNAGLHADYLFASALHVGAELATHVMFPAALFDVDLTVTLGMHL